MPFDINKLAKDAQSAMSSGAAQSAGISINLDQLFRDAAAAKRGDAAAQARLQKLQDQINAAVAAKNAAAGGGQAATMPGQGQEQAQAPYDPSMPPDQTSAPAYQSSTTYNPGGGGVSAPPLPQQGGSGMSLGKVAVGLGLAYAAWVALK